MFANDGRIAVLTRNAIHIYEPTYQYNSFFSINWIILNLVIPSQSQGGTDYVQQIIHSPQNEARLYLSQVLWISNIIPNGEPNLLMLLLNDGQVFIFERCFMNKEE